MSTDDYRALCAELAQPEPEGVTDEEILALSQWHGVSYTMVDGRVIYPMQEGTDMKDEVLSFARAVWSRAQAARPAIKPVPEGPIPEAELAAMWNQQADAFNQWESLDVGEQLAWAQARALALLARPAIKPVPVSEGPTEEELLGLDDLENAWNAQADVVNNWDELGIDEIVWFAQRQALAQPGPQGPTDEEILALSQEHGVSYTRLNGGVIYPRPEGYDTRDDVLSFARAVLARWGRPTIEPVPVSERLPGPEDCDAEGRCWWAWAVGQVWSFCSPPPYRATHWLPAHVLPLPLPHQSVTRD